MLPSLFLAHGSPMLVMEDHDYTRFLQQLAGQLPKPKAIVLFSAHWENDVQQISGAVQYDTIYDFYGFPKPMYQMTYPARGHAPLALEIQQLLSQEGIRSEIDEHRGLDHGAWVLLKLMYPAADIPVITLSVNPRAAMEDQYRIGKALSKLPQEDVLVIGSGGTVHNLRRIEWEQESMAAIGTAWATAFDDWLQEQIETWNVEALLDFENRAPNARDAVPTREHFLPLILAMGTGDLTKNAKLLFRKYQYGTLSLCGWMFGQESS